MPELPICETLQDRWNELGQMDSRDGIPRGFTWAEILAFSQISPYDLGYVELLLLRDMSMICAKYVTDNDPLSIPPVERQTI